MEYVMKLKLFYHKTGFLEIGKFTEETGYCYTEEECRGKLNKLLDILTKGSMAHAWSFSFNAYTPNGEMWSVEKKPSDREKKVFTVSKSKNWYEKEEPCKLKKHQVIEEIMKGV